MNFLKPQRRLLKFECFSETFEDLSHLKQLSLSHNRLKMIEKEVLSQLVKLEILILDYNYLEDINGVFMVLENLKYLSLTHNNVKWFDMAFFPTSVQKISLGENKIEELICWQSRLHFNFCLTSIITISFFLWNFLLQEHWVATSEESRWIEK